MCSSGRGKRDSRANSSRHDSDRPVKEKKKKTRTINPRCPRARCHQLSVSSEKEDTEEPESLTPQVQRRITAVRPSDASQQTDYSIENISTESILTINEQNERSVGLFKLLIAFKALYL